MQKEINIFKEICLGNWDTAREDTNGIIANKLYIFGADYLMVFINRNYLPSEEIKNLALKNLWDNIKENEK